MNKKTLEKNLKILQEELEYKKFLLKDTNYQISILEERNKWQLLEAKKKLEQFQKTLTTQIAEDEFAIKNTQEEIKKGETE